MAVAIEVQVAVATDVSVCDRFTNYIDLEKEPSRTGGTENSKMINCQAQRTGVTGVTESFKGYYQGQDNPLHFGSERGERAFSVT